MRKYLSILSIFALSFSCFGQDNKITSQQVKSLTILGELWGFLKYYHPFAAKGYWDWDSVLISKVRPYMNATDKQTISQLTNTWLIELGKVDACKQCSTDVPDSMSLNLDFQWISDVFFTKDIISQLNYIKLNRNIGSHYYVNYSNGIVNFINEKVYNEPRFQFPTAKYRLLLLFRYWNNVNYFSPYKYLNGRDWKEVLKEKIPAFYAAKDTVSYQLEYVKLITSLNDGHSIVHGAVLEKFIGNFYNVPFLCMLVEDQFVVSSVSNDSAASAINIKKGDVIKSVNGENVINKYKRILPYVNASNDDNRAMVFASDFLFTAKDSVFTIEKERNGKLTREAIQLSQKSIPEIIADKGWKVLKGDIGYVDLGALKTEQVAGMMQKLIATKAIIFDIRNYPNNTWPLIANYLSKDTFIMSSITYPDLDYPGVFLYRKPRYYGKANNKPYNGKVILLVDESSVSHAEFSAMGLQAATQTKTIGNTTAGKDGDITNRFWLPGGLFSRFSGLGIYYPDGTVTHRKGVKIDIKVKPTIKGLQEGRDEVMERALTYIQTNK